MIEFAGQGILLDIEGTTSAVSYVYDVMFPYARRELDRFLDTRWHLPATRQACEQVARDAGHESMAQWCGGTLDDARARDLVRAELIRLMDNDVKATGLKEMQGLIWEAGFETGALRAHVYDDVPAALAAWNAAGRDVRIYSSGSVHAQQLFFAHTEHGNLLAHLRGHYDTTTGPKKSPDSYAAIAAHFALPAAGILFLSDLVDELDAARQAGLATALCRRPGNAPAPPDHGHPVIGDFAEVVLC